MARSKVAWVKNGWVKNGLGQKWPGQKWPGQKWLGSKMAINQNLLPVCVFSGSYIGIKRMWNDYTLQNICAILFCFSFDGHVKKHSKTLVLYILHKSNNIMPPPRSRLQRSKEHSFMKLESSDSCTVL